MNYLADAALVFAIVTGTAVAVTALCGAACMAAATISYIREVFR